MKTRTVLWEVLAWLAVVLVAIVFVLLLWLALGLTGGGLAFGGSLAGGLGWFLGLMGWSSRKRKEDEKKNEQAIKNAAWWSENLRYCVGQEVGGLIRRVSPFFVDLDFARRKLGLLRLAGFERLSILVRVGADPEDSEVYPVGLQG